MPLCGRYNTSASSSFLPQLRHSTSNTIMCIRHSVANEAKKISSETIHQQIGRQTLQTMQYRAVITYVKSFYMEIHCRIRNELSFRAHIRILVSSISFAERIFFFHSIHSFSLLFPSAISPFAIHFFLLLHRVYVCIYFSGCSCLYASHFIQFFFPTVDICKRHDKMDLWEKKHFHNNRIETEHANTDWWEGEEKIE